MKEEKNLDRLFQEKFKDFERLPSDAVWKNILAIKEEKEGRKFLPLWWKLGGVAAVVALLFTTGIMLFNTTPNSIIERDIVTINPGDELETVEVKTVDTNNQVAQTQETLPIEEKKEHKEEAIPTPIAVQDEINTSNSIKGNTTSQLVQNNYVKSNTQNEVNNGATSNQKSPSQKISFGVANTNSDKTNQETTPPSILEHPQEVLSNDMPIHSGIAQTTENRNTIANDANKKKSLTDEAKRIEEDKKEREAVAILEKTPDTNRWGVGAVAAPVYYGDFGGSGIDPSFSDNSKSGDINFSYGVQVSYAVSPKLKVRTGVSNVDLSYNTGGIAFSASPNSRRLTGISYNQNAQALNIADAGSVRQENAVQNGLFSENTNDQSVIDGSLQQRIGFIEVPVEAVYVVSDKRIGVQVIGGLSTLFLNNNEVILNAQDGLQSNLGSANGVNDLSFTTNIGLGLDYKMTDKVKVNLEPSLKYQLNAFDESVGDFKPYFIGLYTGVSYRF